LRNPNPGKLILRLPAFIAFIVTTIEYQPPDEHNSLPLDSPHAGAGPPHHACSGGL
jgi:hypothetical protein